MEAGGYTYDVPGDYEDNVTQHLVREIEAAGYTFAFVDYCEDSLTPGLLGHYAGVTDQRRKHVKVATKNRTPQQIEDTVRHELRHVLDPGWDCGNRSVVYRCTDEGTRS